MRRLTLSLALLLATLAGCGESTGPTAVTPEMEAKLKAEEAAANAEEESMPREDGSPAAKSKPGAKKK